MATKSSDRIIMMFLPAASLLLVYALFVNRGLQNDYRASKAHFESAEAADQGGSTLLIAKTMLTTSQEQRDQTKVDIRTEKERLQELCRPYGAPSQRLAIVEEIEQLAKRFSVVVVSQLETARPKLPTPTVENLQQIDRLSGQEKLTFREYSLRGKYNDVMSLLVSLGEVAPGVIPLQISLVADPSGSDIHEWKLLVAL